MKLISSCASEVVLFVLTKDDSSCMWLYWLDTTLILLAGLSEVELGAT